VNGSEIYDWCILIGTDLYPLIDGSIGMRRTLLHMFPFLLSQLPWGCLEDGEG
jgi:hypothetical protein